MSFPEDMFARQYQHEQEMKKHFSELLADEKVRKWTVGDRVIVATGLLNSGWPWERREATVMEIAGNSTRVRIPSGIKGFEYADKWVHPALIVDVIAAKESSDGKPH